MSWVEMREKGIVSPGVGVLSVVIGKQRLAEADLLDDGTILL